MKKITHSADPDFSKFKKIPPAFAGTLIDWSMGSREITATIIDLVLRDYLSVIGNTIIKNKKSKPLKNFESKFIITIFGQSESLSFQQFSQIAYKKEFDNLLKIIADGMMEEGFVDKNFQEKMANAVKESINEMPVRFAKQSELVKYDPEHYKPQPPQHYENVKVHIIPRWVWIVAGIIFILLNILSLLVNIPGLSSLLGVLWMILIFGIVPILLFAWAISRRMKKKLGKTYDWMLSDVGKNAKIECLNLKKYMETYPLLEDRLANELVSHAIAFGLGKVWMTKMGKSNAGIKLLVESVDDDYRTTYRFMDWDKYLNSFENF